MELCGGTHVSSTGQLGVFKIIKEGSTAAGIRRIQAVTSLAAFNYLNSHHEALRSAAKEIGASNPLHVDRSIHKLLQNQKQVEIEIEGLTSKLIDLETKVNPPLEGNYKGRPIRLYFSSVEMKGIIHKGDELKKKNPDIIHVLISGDFAVAFLNAERIPDVSALELMKEAEKIIGGGKCSGTKELGKGLFSEKYRSKSDSLKETTGGDVPSGNNSVVSVFSDLISAKKNT
eukprot:TRINITY_DN3072_c0_g2_i2.p2 TRINITY_DN3072_c0_g2~~TRINITY_DN3072_c0_g2_i2.p2  ORF type:complete len:230 (-),score=68.94 TRINITY_DN3072_c0_g2_i2:1215-1904(-)